MSCTELVENSKSRCDGLLMVTKPGTEPVRRRVAVEQLLLLSCFMSFMAKPVKAEVRPLVLLVLIRASLSPRASSATGKARPGHLAVVLLLSCECWRNALRNKRRLS